MSLSAAATEKESDRVWSQCVSSPAPSSSSHPSGRQSAAVNAFPESQNVALSFQAASDCCNHESDQRTKQLFSPTCGGQHPDKDGHVLFGFWAADAVHRRHPQFFHALKCFFQSFDHHRSCDCFTGSSLHSDCHFRHEVHPG